MAGRYLMLLAGKDAATVWAIGQVRLCCDLGSRAAHVYNRDRHLLKHVGPPQ